MIELLAVLSLSAAMGLRTAFPLLLLGLFQGTSLWSHVPLLSSIHPQILFGCLISWSLSELIFSKFFLGQRVLQTIQLLLSPFVGAIASFTAIVSYGHQAPVWLLVLVGTLLALVLQLVQVGWFYRLRGLPLWGIWLQDGLCFLLVFLAMDFPSKGGLIALGLLWAAIRSSVLWRRQTYSPYFQENTAVKHQRHHAAVRGKPSSTH